MRSFFLLVGLFLLITSIPARAQLLLKPADRIALCGNGLAENGAGVYFEEYLMMAEPELRTIDIEQFSWIGQDLLTKFGPDVLPFKPTVVVLAYGYGDDTTTHEKTMTDLVRALKKAGVRLVVIGSPPAVDAAALQNDAVRADADNRVRSAIAQINQRVATGEGGVYADVFDITRAAIDKAKGLYGGDYVRQAGWPDAYQLAIASVFVKALGCDGNVGSIAIDYAAGNGAASPGQKLGPMRDNRFFVESTKFAFWFPGHGVGGSDPPPWPALQCLNFDADLNRYTLTVKNLPTAQAKIYWGDLLNRDFSSAELARGVNLSVAMPGWNPFRACSPIDNAVRVQQETDCKLGNLASRGHPDPQAPAKHEAAMQVVRDRIVSLKIPVRIQPLAPIEKQPQGTIPVILDTDLDGDVDDVGALALLNDFMDQGHADLLAVVHDTVDGDRSSCATIRAINTWYGHRDIPIGQYLGEHPAKIVSVVAAAPPGKGAYHDPAQGAGGVFTLAIHRRFEPDFPSDDQMPAGVDVYRKALASAQDGKVVMVSVGLMENIQDLLLSQPDSLSPLSGLDLVRKKVRQLVIMFNTQPADLYVLSHWPTKIIWTCDVGSYIGTGPALIGTPGNNPVRVAYDLFGVLHSGRQSWDLTASWIAVRGAGDLFDLVAGRPQYISDIVRDPATSHPNESVVTIKVPYSEASKIIDAELARPPKK